MAEKDLSSPRAYRFVHVKRPRPAQEQNRPTEKFDCSEADSFLGAPLREVEFVIPPKAEREKRRAEFERGIRAAFVKHLAETQKDALLRAGLTRQQIRGMRDGFTPNGFNTHHKHPIYGGGTNDFSNLVLIRREPYHDMMHYHVITPQTAAMKTGDRKTVKIPDPQTSVYVPPTRYKFLLRWAKQGKKTYGKRKNITLADVRRKAAQTGAVTMKCVKNPQQGR